MELRANPTKIGARLAEKMSQRVILVVAALFVVYTLARPGPQIYSVSSWARDLSSGVTLGVERQGPREAVGDAPLAPATVTGHLLALLATGESVVPIAAADGSGATLPFLWRKSLLGRDPLITCAWGPTCGVTLVDFAAELYGVAALQLGADFFRKHTDHWPEDLQPAAGVWVGTAPHSGQGRSSAL